MPPRKRKSAPDQLDITAPSKKSKKAPQASAEDASNSNRGLLTFPYELRDKTINQFTGIDVFSRAPHPVLPVTFLERTDLLRVLSQVCVAYRRAFLPLLWDSFTACCAARPGSRLSPQSWFKHAGETMVAKCEGLSPNPELGNHIRKAHVVLTRFQTSTVLPKFAATLARFPNLHTLHVLHAHTAMTTAIKNGFEAVSLPQIRTLVIPGNCHEILKRCPGARTVWCISGDGSKLVGVIAKHCKEIEELRGVGLGKENMMKRIKKAVPNLRAFEVWSSDIDKFMPNISAFEKFDTLILRAGRGEAVDEATIKKAATAFENIRVGKQKLHIQTSNAFYHGDDDTEVYSD